MLLCSLSSSYSTFRDTILYSQDTLTLEEVYESLCSKKIMKQLINGSKTKVEGLIAKVKSQEKGSKNSDKGKSKSRSRTRIRQLQIIKESDQLTLAKSVL